MGAFHGPHGLRARLENVLAQAWWSPRASPLARALSPVSALFGVLSRRGAARDRARAGHPGVPVVVVGNLVVGGAGKTPTVIALVRALRAAGWTPGVVSRGHGRRDVDALRAVRPGDDPALSGDEPLLVARATAAPVFVGRRRLDAARALRAAHPEVDVLVADDGLQHHALARDVEVVVFDERGVGNARLLPAGPLRQALPATPPPRWLVLYNAAAPSTPLAGFVAARTLGDAWPLAAWLAGRGAGRPLRSLRLDDPLALAGIGAPQRFFDMLRAAGVAPCETLALPDHGDPAALDWSRWAGRDVLTTEKDAVKLTPALVGAARVWVLPLDFALPTGFVQALLQRLGRPPPARAPDLSALRIAP